MSAGAQVRRRDDVHELRRQAGMYQCTCGCWWGYSIADALDHLREFRRPDGGGYVE